MSGLQIGLIVLIVLVIVGASVGFYMNQESTKRKRTLQVIKGQAAYAASTTSEQDLQNKRRAEIAKKLKQSRDDDDPDKKKKKRTPTALKLQQAGVKITVKQFWLLSVACMIALTLLAQIFGASLFVTIMVAITG